GALALIDGKLNPEDRELAARILARFTQGRGDSEVTIEIKDTLGISYRLNVSPFKEEEIQKEWYV
ncbi:MAG: tRNA (5-methylaminomethyl-2-thiouridylate)-methyltransferase, partial [Gammaproteobacteria bacterium]|nr:tRNA (5-methylaminomethyl-2-thiouridylate)-methyltransferase [Gammaproteobacteria bacterium]